MKRYTHAEPSSQTAFPIARAGYGYIAAAGFATVILAFLGFTLLSLTGLAITFFICFFFRDPDRVTPQQEKVVVAPADGKVIVAQVVDDCAFLDGAAYKISIFMTIFNVHVNRIPYSGKVKTTRYQPGKFVAANHSSASQNNEQNAIWIETKENQTLAVVQIAGLIARRIISYVQPGDVVVRGQRFGLICFGSRLDVYLPASTKVTVQKGETVKAGSSILGELQ